MKLHCYVLCMKKLRARYILHIYATLFFIVLFMGAGCVFFNAVIIELRSHCRFFCSVTIEVYISEHAICNLWSFVVSNIGISVYIFPCWLNGLHGAFYCSVVSAASWTLLINWKQRALYSLDSYFISNWLTHFDCVETPAVYLQILSIFHRDGKNINIKVFSKLAVFRVADIWNLFV